MLLEADLMIKLPKQRVFVLFANKYGLLNKNFEELQYPLQSANQNFDAIVSSKSQKKWHLSFFTNTNRILCRWHTSSHNKQLIEKKFSVI